MKIRCSLVNDMEIISEIKDYLQRKLPNQELVGVSHDKTDADYIYIVLTQEIEPVFEGYNCDYHVYTCWNHTMKNLNAGTHNISEDYAMEIFMGGVIRKYEIIDGKPSDDEIEKLMFLFKDGLIEDDYYEAMKYFRDTCKLDEKKCEYLGINYYDMMHFDDEED